MQGVLSGENAEERIGRLTAEIFTEYAEELQACP
jgi:hypothetical protein